MDFDKKPGREVLSSNKKSLSCRELGRAGERAGSPAWAKNREPGIFLTKEGKNMEIQVKNADRNLLLELSGELDHHGARTALRELEEALDAALPRKLVLDLSGVTFMDSSGIAVILRARQKMQLLDGGLLVRGTPPQARRVLDAAGINRLVTIK